MNAQSDISRPGTTRRQFIKRTSGVLAGATLAGAMPVPGYTAENNTIKVALVGCGGRGTGATANALSTEGPTKLVAMADLFSHRIEGSLKNLKRFGEQLDVPAERKFLGMDAYKKAVDAVAPGGVVLLATPPAFRPIHLEYAVERGCHVFMEKSFAVDVPGVQRVLRAGQEATKKSLKIAGGLMSRHYLPLQEAVKRIHDGEIGDVITCWAYRAHGPVGFASRGEGVSELAHQIRNYSCFTWLNGSFLLDWLIHNIDVCCWVKNAWPVSAQGQGGRQVRTKPDQLFDHYAVEYTFADGTRLFAQGRHMGGCWGYFGDVIHGAKGSAVLGEGIPRPLLYRSHQQTRENVSWRYRGANCNAYQVEHDRLFQAIREDKPYNETERSAHAALAGILGRMAAESGQLVTWEQALGSKLELAPGLDRYTMDSEPPVRPDAEGRYPIAVPGITNVL